MMVSTPLGVAQLKAQPDWAKDLPGPLIHLLFSSKIAPGVAIA